MKKKQNIPAEAFELFVDEVPAAISHWNAATPIEIVVKEVLVAISIEIVVKAALPGEPIELIVKEALYILQKNRKIIENFM